MAILEFGLILHYGAVLMMGLALSRSYPDCRGWRLVSRSLAWPVTLYELSTNRF